MSCGPAKGAGGNFRRLRMTMEKGENRPAVSQFQLPPLPGLRQRGRGHSEVRVCGPSGLFQNRRVGRGEPLRPGHLFPGKPGFPLRGGKAGGCGVTSARRPRGHACRTGGFTGISGLSSSPESTPTLQIPRPFARSFPIRFPTGRASPWSVCARAPEDLWGPSPRSTARNSSGASSPTRNSARPTVFSTSPLRPSGNIEFSLPKGNPAGKEKNEKYRLTFIQGKVVTQWQQTMTNFAPSLAQFSSGRTVQVHPDTAKEYQVADGDEVIAGNPVRQIADAGGSLGRHPARRGLHALAFHGHESHPRNAGATDQHDPAQLLGPHFGAVQRYWLHPDQEELKWPITVC